VKFWTAHTRPHAEPMLLREGFSWGALVFGPFWLFWHRAWIPASIVLAIDILIGVLLDDPFGPALTLGLAWFLGLSGRDLVRWSVEHRGYVLTHVFAARDETEALARLLADRPDLRASFMPPEAAR
jgi:hypothetical protein